MGFSQEYLELIGRLEEFNGLTVKYARAFNRVAWCDEGSGECIPVTREHSAGEWNQAANSAFAGTQKATVC